MIKAILFDLDNTLIDFKGMKKIATKAAAQAMIDAGLKMDPEEAYEKLMQVYLEQGIESETWLGEFLKQYAETDDVKIAVATNAYRKMKAAYLEPYPSVIPTLVKLIKKGVKLGIISDAPKLKALKRLDSVKLLPFFDIIITEAGKPEKQAFLKAIEVLQLNPEEILMVGDIPERDIAGAKQAGLKTCFAEYGYREKLEGGENIITDSGADYQIKNVDELISVVEK